MLSATMGTLLKLVAKFRVYQELLTTLPVLPTSMGMLLAATVPVTGSMAM